MKATAQHGFRWHARRPRGKRLFLIPLTCLVLGAPVWLGAADNSATAVFEDGMRLLGQGKEEEGARRVLEAASLDARQGEYGGAYWYAWQLARHSAKAWGFDRRLEWFDLAESYLKKRSRSAPTWRYVDLSNYVQLLCEKETLYAQQGRFGLGYAAFVPAETLMEECLGTRQPTEAVLRRATETVRGVYISFLLDRADYQARRGELPGAKLTFEEAVRVGDLLVEPTGRDAQRCRTFNNFAVLLELLGHDDAGDAYAAKAAALRVADGAGDIAQVSSLRRRSEREGPSEDIVRLLLDKAAALRDRKRDGDALSAERRAASVLYELGETERAERICAEVIAKAVRMGGREVAAQAYFWRGKARARIGAPGAEEDLLAALDFYRREAGKPHECRVYKAYAGWLAGKGRLRESLAVMDEALRLNALMQSPCLRPELLAGKADVLARLGCTGEADALWAEALRIMAGTPELSAHRRLQIHVDRLKYLALLGRSAEVDAYYAQVSAFVEGATLTEYQKRAFTGFDPKQAGGAETAAAPLPGTDFQPAYVSTRTPTQSEAHAWMWLLNPAPVRRHGTLTVAAKGSVNIQSPGGDRIDVEIDGTAPGNGGGTTTNVSLGPSSTMAVRLVHGALSRDEMATVALNWVCEGSHETRWDVAGGAEDFESKASISTSLLWLNPFYSIPLYHEIRAHGADPSEAQDFRVRSSEPCRLEVYRASDSALWAVDADGNGSYADEGDLVGADSNHNALPDADGPLSVMILMFPAPGRSYDKPIDLVVEVLLEDKWVSLGSDRIVP